MVLPLVVIVLATGSSIAGDKRESILPVFAHVASNPPDLSQQQFGLVLEKTKPKLPVVS
jgi:hypothetical protein